MASVTFKYGAQTKTLNLFEARVSRKHKRARYSYHNGGSDSNYIACQLKLELKWEHLSTTDYTSIVTVLDWIRQGYDVYWESFSGLSYLHASAVPTGTVLIDVEDDEVLEQDFKLFEKMPFEITFVSRNKRGLTHSS